MPHLTLDYSANLADRADIGALCQRLHGVLMASGLFEPGAPRVRAHAAQDYAIADLHPANAYLDAVLRLAQGRSVSARRELARALMTEMEDAFAGELAGGHFALSLEFRETDGAMSWKTNSIHRRLRGE
jgi:5-carboxymethyl-2-hydroxymuconate isomerase